MSTLDREELTKRRNFAETSLKIVCDIYEREIDNLVAKKGILENDIETYQERIDDQDEKIRDLTAKLEEYQKKEFEAAHPVVETTSANVSN